MNTRDMDDVAKTASSAFSPEWQRVVLSLALGLLLVGALFSGEIAAAVGVWLASTAYNHCFLIIPIVMYLIWDRRHDLAGIAPSPMPSAAWLALPLVFAWLLAERLGIMEGRQFVAVSFAELLVLAVLGKRLWWAMAGPLLYLYFLVPFGEFLVPSLQDFTSWFIRHGLAILNVPAYVDGYSIEIPQGIFYVAEACAGLRFLIASLAFGCLYALAMYRTPLRRGLFIVVSVVVPIIANGFRALGIVYLGYRLNSVQAAAADHIIYGWVFFSAVILLLVALGLPFRQDDVAIDRAVPQVPAGGWLFPTRRALTAVLAIALIAAVGRSLAAGLTAAAAAPIHTPAALDVGPDCVVRAAAPAEVDRSAVQTQRVLCGDVVMDMSWEMFSPRASAAALMAERRRLMARAQTETRRERWLEPDARGHGAWQITTSSDQAFTLGTAIWIDGQPIRPGLTMRARMALDSLIGSGFAPMIVTVTPAVDWSTLTPAEREKAQASVAVFLLGHPDLERSLTALSAV